MRIDRLGGPKPARLDRNETRPRAETTTATGANNEVQDEVQISTAASNIVQFMDAVRSLPDVRQERVDSARQNMERGSYRSQEAVRQVAERVGKYVVNE